MAANRRLHPLREQHQANKEANQSAHVNAPVDDTLPWQEPEPSEESGTAVQLINKLPAHLGWESDVFTQAVRQSQQQQERIKTKHERFPAGQAAKQSSSRRRTQPSDSKPQGCTVKHYPSIGLAALKTEQTSIYRVWLLCRYLDAQGRGWLDIQEVRQQVTETDSNRQNF